MPSVDQQFAAVFGAPVPFGLAVFVVAIAIWKAIAWAYGWRYGGTIEKLEAMLRLVAEERRTASDRENTLASTVDSLKATADSLKAELEKSKIKIEAKVARQLETSTIQLATDFARLREANTGIDEALRRGAAVTTMGSSMFTEQQHGTPLPLRLQVPVGQQWGAVQPKVPVAGEPKVTVAEKPNVTSRSE
jgi:hypothetical protein